MPDITLDNKLSQILNDKTLSESEKYILRNYKEALDNIRAQLAYAYAQYGDKGKISLEIMSKYGRLEKLESEIVKAMNTTLKKTNYRIESAINNTFIDTYFADAYGVEQGTTSGFHFAGINQNKINAIIEDGTVDLVKWPARMKRNVTNNIIQVQDLLMQGMAQNQTYTKTAKLIKERLDISATQALRIVRTETHNAQEIAHAHNREVLESKLRKSKVYKMWDAVFVDGGRNHQELDGVEKENGKEFSINGHTTQRPGAFGVASEDINCRCSIRTIIKNANFEMTKPKITWQEYKKNKLSS